MIQNLQKSTVKVFLLAANCALGCFFFGYSMSQLGFSFDVIESSFGKEDKQQIQLFKSNAQTLFPIGAAITAFASGFLVTCFKKRNLFILADVFGIVGVIIGVVSIKQRLIWLFYSSRLLIGLAVGLTTALANIYMKEFTPRNLSGMTGSLTQITINLGILIPALLALGYKDGQTASDSNYWLLVFLLPLIPCVIRIFNLLFVYKRDPPSYYAGQGQEEIVRELLEKIYKSEFVDQQLIEIQRDQQQKKVNTQTFSDLFTPFYRKRLVVGCLLFVLQQFSGINAVMFYSSNIFQALFTDETTQNTLNITVLLFNLIFSIIAGKLTSNFGRKVMLLYGNLACCISLIALGTLSWCNQQSSNYTLQIFIVIFLFVYIIFFQMSLGPIVWIYVADILPEKGQSLAVLTNWICTGIITYTFPLISGDDGQNIAACFFAYSVCCGLGMFLIGFFVKETKDRNAVSIDVMFSMTEQLLGSNTEPTQSN